MASSAETLLGSIRQAADRTGAIAFLRWCLEEVVAAIPANWRRKLAPPGAAYVIAGAEGWRIAHQATVGPADATGQAAGTLAASGSREEIRRIIEEAAGGAPNACLVLPEEQVLVRRVAFPMAAEEALREAIGFDLDRLCPYSQQQAYFDFRVVGRDAVAQRLEIELVVAARAPVDSHLGELRRLGVTVVGVGVAGDMGSSTAPFNLLDPEARERPAAPRNAAFARVMGIAAASLMLAVLIYPLWQKREAVIELAPRLESAKAGADVAERLAKEIEKSASEYNYLLAKKHGSWPTAILVEDLSRLLPDNTWVQQLDIKSGPKIRELQISGESGSSSQLIELLERSGSLFNASFKSPLTKGVTPGTERFLISAEVKPRDLPAPLSESDLLGAHNKQKDSFGPREAPDPPPGVPGQAAGAAAKGLEQKAPEKPATKG